MKVTYSTFKLQGEKTQLSHAVCEEQIVNGCGNYSMSGREFKCLSIIYSIDFK